jgi:hypothetical protein
MTGRRSVVEQNQFAFEGQSAGIQSVSSMKSNYSLFVAFSFLRSDSRGSWGMTGCAFCLLASAQKLDESAS